MMNYDLRHFGSTIQYYKYQNLLCHKHSLHLLINNATQSWYCHSCLEFLKSEASHD